MPHDQLIALLVFCTLGSFTPGPNTIVASVTGASFGVRATLPHVFGVPLGFTTMLAAAAGGVAALVATEPAVAGALRWAGIAYMAWLTIGIARASGDAGDAAAPPSAGGPFRLPLGLWQSALFQFLNPKAWMLALAIAGTWLAGAAVWQNTITASIVFDATAIASLLAWAGAGAALRRWLAARGQRAFNLSMAAALAATTAWLALRG